MALPNPNPGGAAGAGVGAATVNELIDIADGTQANNELLFDLNKGFDKLLRTQEKMLSVLLKAFGGPKVDPDEQRQLKDTAGGEKGKDLDLKSILEKSGGFGMIFSAALLAYALDLDKYIRVFLLGKTIKAFGAIPKAFGVLLTGVSDFFKKLGTTKALKGEFFKIFGKGSELSKFMLNLSDFFTRFVKFFGPVGKVIKSVINFFGGIGVKIGQGFQLFGDVLSKIGKFVDDIILGPFRVIGKLIAPLLGGASKFLAFAKGIPIIGQVIAVLFAVFDFIKGFIEGFASKGENDSRGMLERVFDGMVNGAVEVIRGILIIPLDLLKSGFSWLMGALGFTELEKTLDSFSFNEMYDKFIAAYKNFFSTEPEEGYFSIVRFLLDGVESGVASVKSGIEGAGDMASKAFDAIVNFVTNLFSTDPEEGQFSIVKFIMDKVQNIKDTIKGFFGGGDDAGGGGFSLSNIFGNIDFELPTVENILAMVGTKVNDVFQFLAGKIHSLGFPLKYLAPFMADAGVAAAKFMGVDSVQKFTGSKDGGMETVQLKEAMGGANGGGGQGTAAGEMSKEVAAKKETPPPAAIDASTKTGDTVTNNSKVEVKASKVEARATDNPSAGNRQQAKRGR